MFHLLRELLQKNLKRAKALLRKRGKLFFGGLSVLLFVFNYQVCEFFYKDDITKWWYLKSDLLAISICSSLIAASIGTSGIVSSILALGVGWSISDVVDRVFFDVRYFTMTDLIMVVLTIIYACYEYCTNSNK